jgi:hypothetical protein
LPRSLEQGPRGAKDGLLVIGRHGQRHLPAQGGEIGIAQLDGDCASGQFLAPQPFRYLLAHAPEVVLEHLLIGDVTPEGPLLTDRLDLMFGNHGAPVNPPRSAGQGSPLAAEPEPKLVFRQLSQLTHAGHIDLC